MNKSLPLAGALAALAVLAAGCGMSPQAAATPRPAADPVAVYHQFAQCIRDHGLPDFPDPTIDAQGQPQLPPGVDKPPDAILQACMSILNQLPASSRPRQDVPNDPAMMRRFAQCMRQHGIDDWPDPDASGNFHFPPSLSGNIKTGPRWQQISAAWNGPCKQYDPSGHISTAA
jgi:hypothetical protein